MRTATDIFNQFEKMAPRVSTNAQRSILCRNNDFKRVADSTGWHLFDLFSL